MIRTVRSPLLLAVAIAVIAAGVWAYSKTSLADGPATVPDAPSPETSLANDPPTAPDAPSPADEGKTLFENKCGSCHELSMTTDLRKTADEWAVTIADMLERGAPLNYDDAEKIYTYLVENYGQ